MTSLQQVILPWPFDTLKEEQVREIATRAFDETVKGLLAPNRPLTEIKPRE